MLEAVFEAAAMMIVDLVLVLRIDIATADLPEERMEPILVAILLEIIDELDLIAVRLEVRPHIPVDRTDHLASQILCHAQDVNGGHLILHADRILTERTKRDVNVVVLAMLCEVDREVRVARMVDVAAWRLQEIVDRLLIHIRRTLACQFLPIGSRRIRRHDAGTVKAVKRDDLNILDLDDIARHNRAAPLCRYAPFDPCLHGPMKGTGMSLPSSSVVVMPL